MALRVEQPSQDQIIDLAACPRCGAPEGERCNREGENIKRGKGDYRSHQERMTAVRRILTERRKAVRDAR